MMLMDNNQIFRNWFVIIHRHLTKVSAEIIWCIIFECNELSITLFIYSMDTTHYTVNWCKKVPLVSLICFQVPVGFQNFIKVLIKFTLLMNLYIYHTRL